MRLPEKRILSAFTAFLPFCGQLYHRPEINALDAKFGENNYKSIFF